MQPVRLGVERRQVLDRPRPRESVQALEGGCVFVTGSVEFDDQPGALHDALVRNQTDWAQTMQVVKTVPAGELPWGVVFGKAP